MNMNLCKNKYYFDVNTHILHMTKAFERQTLQYGSEAFQLVQKLRQMFPDMALEIKSRPARKKPLSYQQMRQFIALLPNAQAGLEEMNRQQKMSVAYKSPYKYMEKWFHEQYPFHEELLVKNEEGGTIWDVVEQISPPAGGLEPEHHPSPVRNFIQEEASQAA